MTMDAITMPKVGTALLDESGVFRWVDKDVCAILSMEQEQMLGSPLTQLFPLNAANIPRKGESGQFFETPFLRGSADWLETAWLRIVIRHTELRPDLPVMLLVEDISREKARAHALVEVQQRYAMIINANPSPLAFLLPNGTLADCNKAATDLTGQKKSDLIGNPSWISLWFHGNKDKVARLSFVVGQARNGKAAQVTLPVTEDGGSERQYCYAAKPILDNQAGVIGLLMEAHDVSSEQAASSTIYEKVTSELSTRFSLLERSLASVNDCVLWLDADGRLIEANDFTCTILGYDRRQLLDMTLADLLEARPDLNRDQLIALTEAEGTTRRDLWLRRVDGTTFPADVSLTKMEHHGAPIFCGIMRDISTRKASEQQLQVLAQAVENSPQVVLVTDWSGHLQYANRAFSDSTGYSQQEVLGKVPNFLNPETMEADQLADLHKTLDAGGIWRGDVRNWKKNGDEYQEHLVVFAANDDQGVPSHVIVVKDNITLRQEYAKALAQQIDFDTLTGLPNRALAMKRLSASISHACLLAFGRVVTMVIDIDNLKKINLTLGHEAGDRIIAICGQRIVDVVQSPDIVARIEGDTFLVTLDSVLVPEEVEHLAERIAEECGRPYRLDQQEVFLTVRIGISVFPADGTSPHELLHKAYVAGRRAKEPSGGVYHFYTSRMDANAGAWLRIEAELQHAIERNELQLVYHPLVTARSKRIVGAEALLRWNSAELGAVSPADFIPVAENSDLIIALSDWVLKTACRDAAGWLDNNWGSFTLAVNFSPRQFGDRRLLDKVMATLKETGLPPSALEVEVTERLLMTDTGKHLSVLNEMKEAGMSLSIDDFGTGYSSLSYVRKYPFNRLKIDQSFVADIPHSPGTQSVVTAIVEMAHALGMEVTAEGVETVEHEQCLTAIGCEILQGYRFGKPMPAQSFQRLLTGSADAIGGAYLAMPSR